MRIKSNDIINEVASIFKEKEFTVTSSEGKEYKILIKDNLNDTAIAEMIDQLQIRAKWCTDNGVKFEIVQCMYGLMLRNFTDIQFQASKDIGKMYHTEIKTMNALIDLGLFSQILEKFNSNSVEKIKNTFTTYAQSMRVINNEIIQQNLKEE